MHVRCLQQGLAFNTCPWVGSDTTRYPDTASLSLLLKQSISLFSSYFPFPFLSSVFIQQACMKCLLYEYARCWAGEGIEDTEME